MPAVWGRTCRAVSGTRLSLPRRVHTIRVALVSGFFQPPPSSWAEPASGGDPPRWTGRPQGPPPGEVVNDLTLARSDAATVYIAYVDAYPEGFEFDVKALLALRSAGFAAKGRKLSPTSSAGIGRWSARGAT